MNNSKITIFYSWQSDLPGNQTRNFIQDCIEDAVKKFSDTVGIEADRDTKGEFGSPDISQTIFSKIDNCDIFIADVSAVCNYEIKNKNGKSKHKYTPNPNVMLELGYAAHVVGWDNIICVLNSDFGAPEKMPFDIAKRRLTPYSLGNMKKKSEEKNRISIIIQETIKNILEKGKRVKSGFSNLQLGYYNKGEVSRFFNSIKITNLPSYVNYKEKLISECLKLIGEVKNIEISEPSELQSTQGNNSTLASRYNSYAIQRVFFDDARKDSIICLCKKYLGVDISEETEFFYIGNLEERRYKNSHESFEGSNEEKDKYNHITNLADSLFLLQTLDLYVLTFDGMLLIPLVIENISTVYDESIDVHIKINKDAVDVIVPSEGLINQEMKGWQPIIYKLGIIKNILMMQEPADISYDTDISSSIADILAENRSTVISGMQYNANDYVRELSKYIASPIAERKSEFKFNIGSLKAKERKWVGPAVLVKPLKDSFEINYTIKSKQSGGDLNGTITYTR